jgi:hypothetical protein
MYGLSAGATVGKLRMNLPGMPRGGYASLGESGGAASVAQIARPEHDSCGSGHAASIGGHDQNLMGTGEAF